MTSRSDQGAVVYGVWPTAAGPMGAVAGPGGLRRVELPVYSVDQLAEVLAWQFPGARRDDRPFEQLVRLTRDYWNARAVDFSQVLCELPPPGSFTGRVLRACRRIAYGRTCSYGALAAQIGRPAAARAVAGVMAKNPIPLVIPCHRVVYSDGRLGGFSAPGGLALKRRMLQLEQTGLHRARGGSPGPAPATSWPPAGAS